MFHPGFGKIFKFLVFAFAENALNLDNFTHVPLPSQKFPPKILSSPTMQEEIIHSPGQKGMEETVICFIKIQSKKMKITLNIKIFIFCMICDFSNVMTL